LSVNVLDFTSRGHHNAQQFSEFRNEARLRENTMKRLRIYRCLLLFGALLAVAGCRSNAVADYIPKNEAQQDYVTIHNCVAIPDSVTVPDKKKVHWAVRDDTNDSDKAKYIVSFLGTNPINGDIPIVSSTLPDTVHTVNTGCTTIHVGCGRIPYRLVQINAGAVKVCDDPGIHVVPPSFFSFLTFWK
jgi:hypothetical protein